MAKEPLEPIAFDIETQGLLMRDEITVAGLRLPLGALILLNSNGRTVSDRLEERVREESGLDAISLHVCDGEEELLTRLRDEANERIRGKNRMLVAFNGETWRGGFDLSFLRTRCGFNEVPWPFDDIPYADLMPIVQKRVNTTVDSKDSPTEIGDLCGAYDALIGGDHCDPYEDSSEAVTADYDGDWESLVLHNVADIDRTQQLADWMQRYVPASDFKLKNLGPPCSRRW
ncbi:ribonuclease H-like domain-containing protein [Halogeometricum sp. CBA1124]|uniref:ribonuclease H-like domain-containing protein n=1 Tax=Halogeometricum sp. CBA1124 TaxID=2668071 RepID=UPI00142CD61F|nr:ribonuclease H-like domain-containing protein [Halogeometricum sp. CBA1124]MUV56235.1 hypothetical protein [Halogeometricum sp. CBA1124]